MKQLYFNQNDVFFHRREYIIRCLFLIMAIFAVNVNSFAFEVDGIKYNIENSETKEVSVAGLSSSNTSSEVSIPESVEFSDITYVVSSIESYAFRKNSNIVLIELPKSIKTIGSGAFYYCDGLTSITIPKNVTSIEHDTFFKCVSLKSIIIPDHVISIEKDAFSYCENLKAVDLPESLLSIGNYAFQHTAITSITIPANLTSIGSYAFSGCPLELVKSKMTQPFNIQQYVFGYTGKNVILQVPKGTKSNYLQLSGWSDFKLIIEEGVNYYDVTFNKIGDGLGDIKYNNESVTNSQIIKYVEEGTIASISISPSYGSQIKSVKVNGADVTSQISNDVITVTINSDTTIDIEFEKKPVTPITYSFSITASGNGSVIYGSESIKGTTKNYSLESGSNVTVTFNPDNGYQIKSVKLNNFDIAYQINNNSYTATIYSNTTLDVEFEANPVDPTPIITTYSFSIKASGNGSVLYGDETIRKTTKTYTLNSGSSATVSFNPDNGYRVKSVKVNDSDVSVGSSYSTTINSNTTIEVEFEANATPTPEEAYTLTITASGNGSVLYGDETIRKTTKTYTLNSGSSATVSFNPDNGYRVKSVKVNGSDVSVGSSYSTTINSNTTIEVEFEANATPTPTPTPEESYTLAITASGGGIASYQGETIKNGTKSYILSKGSDVLINFDTDAGNRIKQVSQNNEDITAKISNYRYSFTITSNTTITVDFEELENTIVDNGINYYVESYDQHRVKVNEGNYIKVLSVPEKINVLDQEWTVIGIVNKALDNCENLSAIIWNPAYKFDARVSNPNLLLYVKSADYAPNSVNNVIVNGTAKSITLTDAHSGNDFFCPQTFTAEKISYTHRYGMKTGMGESRGWETIALPFDVQHITLADKEIKSFATWKNGDAAKPFWLYQLGSKGYVEAESIKAYTPYLISLPNNEKYMADYRLAGSVKFSAESVEIKKSDDVNVFSYNGRRFVPNFATQETNAGLYALNVNNEYETYQGGEVEGSKFVLNLRQIHPFEAYMTTTAGTRSIEIFGQMTTAIKDNWMVEDNPGVLRVYDLSGKMVGQGSSVEEIKRVLPVGVYIVNHQKIIIK